MKATSLFLYGFHMGSVRALPPLLALVIKAVGQTAAVDVEGFQNDQDVGEGDAEVLGPEDDVEVFLTSFEAVEDAVEEEGVFLEAFLEEAEVAAVEFDPEALPFEVFDPAGTQIAPPVFSHPTSEGSFPQVPAGFFTFNPFEPEGLLLAFGVDARFFHGMENLFISSLPVTGGAEPPAG